MNSDQVVLVVPAALVEVIKQVTTDYARATGQSEEDCRRLVELGILTRGLESMRRQVEIEQKTTERMGWTT